MKNKKHTLPVSEVFYSLQGEGKTIGVPSVFVRLSGCNLLCGGNGTQRDGELHDGATWRCDTIEVWTNGTETLFDNILNQEQLKHLKNGAHLIITGGEPMLYQERILDFIEWLDHTLFFDQNTKKFKDQEFFVEIETNGTIMPSPEFLTEINQFNISPKLANSGMPLNRRCKENVITAFEDSEVNLQYKFVVSSDSDWKEIQQDYLHLIRRENIYLMPAGSSQDELSATYPIVADMCKNYDLKFSPRLHVDIWNQKTGV